MSELYPSLARPFHDAESEHPFKGDVDIAKLDALVDRVGADRIPYVSLEGNVNMAGGQPFSMGNLRELRRLRHPNGVFPVKLGAQAWLYTTPPGASGPEWTVRFTVSPVVRRPW